MNIEIVKRRFNRLFGMVYCTGAFFGANLGMTQASEADSLTLGRYLHRVWAANEMLQVRALEAAITDEQLEAEWAIFDPAFVAQFDAVDRRRPNTTQQSANLGFSALFNERNRTYQSALETLAPRGGRVRFGYTLSELNNNLNAGTFGNGEFVSTFGLTLVQPLLRGAGKSVTMAGIRAAAINSDIGFQDYRRGMMEVLGRAEIAYWDLYEAQAQYQFALESLRLANELLRDSQKRLEVGKGTQLSAMQAEAGVALREATKLEASRRLGTARSRLLTFMGTRDRARLIEVSDVPGYGGEEPSFATLWQSAFEANPDFVALRKRAELDGLRVVVAKNAKLPQLDMTAGYGFSGIGSSPGASLDRANSDDFPDWSIGLQFRIPIMGDRRADHEHKAAQLRRKATELGMDNFGKELETTLRASVHSVGTYRENGQRYKKVVEFNLKLLDSQIKSAEAGQADSRDVLEAEEDLFQVRVTGVGNAVRYKRALLELQMLSGVLLSERGLDLTRAELRERTAVVKAGKAVDDARYEEFLRRTEVEYGRRMERKGVTPRDFNTPEAPGWFKWNGIETPLLNDEYLESRNFPQKSPAKFNLSVDVPESEAAGGTSPADKGGAGVAGKGSPEANQSGFFKWNGF